MTIKVSIIIPALNESAEIAKTLAALNSFGKGTEIILADGGSTDETAMIARRHGAKVIDAPPGRGRQMHTGALHAVGDVLWFIHADSVPSPDSLPEIEKVFSDETVVGGNLTLRFSGSSLGARFMTHFYPHLRKIGLMYGDSGIFLRRDIYAEIGGFKPLPLFEDLDLVRRARKRGRLLNLKAEIVTSSRRFEGRAFFPVFLQWVLFQCLFWLGVSPERLAKAYYHSPPTLHSGSDAEPNIS